MNWQELSSQEQRNLLNADYVRGLLHYDELSGRLTWKRYMGSKAKVNDEAGVIQSGKYRRIGIHGKYYLAHRLAWLIVTGEWPMEQIDHINGIKSDNRLINLRQASSRENKLNTLHENNSGLVGANFHKGCGKYRAQIRVENKRIFLGWFITAEEASAAYVVAAKKYHGEFAKC